jgi:circadian clock protein KaiC
VRQGRLQFHATRPNLYGLEMHLLSLHEAIHRFRPRVVVIDPITNLIAAGSEVQVKSMIARLIDFLKTRQVTALFTSLTSGEAAEQQSEIGVSSLMDSWLLLRNEESGGEHRRALYVLKSRGMAHSSHVRGFSLTDRGICPAEVDLGSSPGLARSARGSNGRHPLARPPRTL